ncbi:hypothetical protein GCM10027270_28350 [Nocardioides ginkgobilobae]
MSDLASARYRAAVAVEMRLAGSSYDDISQALGFANRSGAWKAVDRTLGRIQDQKASAYFAETMNDLDMLHERAWAAAMAGDLKAIATCLRAGRMKRRLAGCTCANAQKGRRVSGTAARSGDSSG